MNFTEGFLWGTATAAYQIEGAVDEDGRGRSIWDTFSHTPGKVLHDDTGDTACDHYHRLEEDLDLLKELGVKGYRFSVAWPRIQPDGRAPANQKGLDFYRRLVEGLHRRDIEPMLTLYHWDLPQALEDKGGWTSRETSEYFAEYVGIVYESLSDVVSYWITLNEPWVSAWLGYGMGAHAPGHSDTEKALAATHHLLLGHGLALERMRSIGSMGGEDNQLGITLNLSPVRPSRDREPDRESARRVDGNANRLYLDPIFRGSYPEDVIEHYADDSDFSFVRGGDLDLISAPVDFLGVNYYMRHTVRDDEGSGGGMWFPSVRARTVIPHNAGRTAMGWPVEPDGLTELLVRLKTEYTDIPIYITENGVAFDDYADPEGHVNDDERIDFLDAHFRAAHEAMNQGVNLKGYFVWSLMDNFEWAEGYSKRFGIVHVDYPTQHRTPKKSYEWYRGVIGRNGLEDV